MGSGVLLAALVVLWFVVLVPMVVTRGDSQGGRAELASSGRTLQRRRTVDPVVHAPTERVSIDRDALRTSGELQVDVHALRRRTLAGLAALAALSLVAAVLYSPWLWVANAVLDEDGHETVAAESLPQLPHPSVPLAPVHPLRPGRVVAARTPAPVGWQHSAVVGLDDDDIGFADIDEYQPRRVASL